ncbi:MAG: HAD-IA family hydrolase [Armatimonadetes bacterium]|nr:HAD-IA family hydrolase [Armatimonadota bacterium]
MSGSTLKALLIDLDNTLYRPEAGLLSEADRRITQFIQQRLGLPRDLADKLRVELWKKYGTTARGLAVEYGISEQELAREALSEVDASAYVSADEKLAAALSQIPVPLYLFTNAPRDYALRALRALGVERFFTDIFDIEFLEWEGKPSEGAFRRVLRVLALPPPVVGLADDNPDNLATARRLGMLVIAVHVDAQADIVIPDICALASALRERGFI